MSKFSSIFPVDTKPCLGRVYSLQGPFPQIQSYSLTFARSRCQLPMEQIHGEFGSHGAWGFSCTTPWPPTTGRSSLAPHSLHEPSYTAAIGLLG